MKIKLLKGIIECVLLIFYNNVFGLNYNFESFNIFFLYEYDFNFNIIGVMEIKFINVNE